MLQSLSRTDKTDFSEVNLKVSKIERVPEILTRVTSRIHSHRRDAEATENICAEVRGTGLEFAFVGPRHKQVGSDDWKVWNSGPLPVE
jgi:hypothetical protein